MSVDASSPVVHLVRQHIVRRGIGRTRLGHALGGNPTKTFRHLDQLLRGERLNRQFVLHVADALGIPPEQLAVAWESHDQQKQQRRAAASRRAMGASFDRRGLHLWGILPKDYLPSLITVLGAEHYLLVDLPEELRELPHYELLREVGGIVRLHYRDQRRCRLAGYEFRRSMHEVYRFTVDGQYEGRVDGSPVDCRTFVRVGGREVEWQGLPLNPK